MAEKCFPLENTMYTAADAQMWFATRTSGVYAGEHLPVTAAGTMDVTVGAGIAWLHYDEFAGIVYGNTDNRMLAVSMSDAQYDRIDRVCVRLEILNNLCYLYVKKGAASSSPVPPALQRDNVAYEISLAQIRVGVGVVGINAGDITDERLDAEVCGVMSDGVTGIDTSVIHAQVEALIEDVRRLWQDAYDGAVPRDPGVVRFDEVMSLTETEKDNVYTSLGLNAETPETGLQMELLWENASPLSNFLEQEITTDLKEGEFALVVYTTGSSGSHFSVIVSYDLGWFNMSGFYDKKLALRTCRITENIFLFTEGNIMNTYGTFVHDDMFGIPVSIYRIKGVT